jgi:hypothetical protein
MSHELLIFWRRPDGTRCVVGRDELRGWELRVIRGTESLHVEYFADAHALFARAQELRIAYKSTAA